MEESKTYYAGLTRRFGTAALAGRMRYNPRITHICKDIVALQQAEDDIQCTITDEQALNYMNTPRAQGIIQQAQDQQPTVDPVMQKLDEMTKSNDKLHRNVTSFQHRLDDLTKKVNETQQPPVV